MPARLLQRLTARPRRSLLALLLLVGVAAALGGPVFTALQDDGGFVAADAESVLAVEQLERATGTGATPAIIALVPTPTAERGDLVAVERALGALDGVAATASVASTDDTGLVSRDGRTAAVALTLRADADEDAVLGAVERTVADRPGVLLGGPLVANTQVSEQIKQDLGRAELLAFPLLLLLSFVFFRGRRPATMPLVVGVTTVLATFVLLRGINEVEPLSIFALNLVIGLGLGLAIDYVLLLLTRFREELARLGGGEDAVAPAIATTMRTAGRTVVFSATTVAIALASLTLFPLNFLQSMGIGGAAVAIVAAIAACAITPVFLALWGTRLAVEQASGDGAASRWYRLSHGVMRRPGLIAVLTAVVMVSLALPALRAQWTPVDASVIPTSLSSRQVADALALDFPRDDSSPITVSVAADASDGAAVEGLAREIAALDGVARVAPAQPVSDDTWRIDIAAEGALEGTVAQGVVTGVRDLPTALGVRVGGEAAEFVDQQAAISDRLPHALVALALLTFVVLWVMTGSVVLPLKALVMNALTVGTTLGVLTLIFQDGRLEGLLGYTSNGGIESTDFVVTAAIVFALSTDYGVFLLERIKEDRARGLGERESVAAGLARTGAVVTAAAILLAVAIGAFSTSSVLFIKQIGVGAAIGVLVDAFIVRALLVPSLMALLGRWNWWSPAPLARLHARLGLAGGGPAPDRPAAGGAGPPRPATAPGT